MSVKKFIEDISTIASVIKASNTPVSSELQKEIYSQTQHWARHNENLIVAANGLVISGNVAIFVAWIKLFNSEHHFSVISLLFAIELIALIAITLTKLFLDRYKQSIERIIFYENFFGFHMDDEVLVTATKHFQGKKWENFVPQYLHQFEEPPTVTAFNCIHAITIIFTLVAISWVTVVSQTSNIAKSDLFVSYLFQIAKESSVPIMLALGIALGAYWIFKSPIFCRKGVPA